MFCKQCGKEVREGWNTCPNCGAPLNRGGSGAAGAEQQKAQVSSVNPKEGKEKIKKPIFKRVWFWILVIVIVFFVFAMMGGSDEKKEIQGQSADTEVKTLEEVGGLAQWKKDGFPGKVRTEIVVDLPVTSNDKDMYAVHMLTALGDVVFVKQEDGSPSSEWEWLNNAVPNYEGGDTASFKVTLTFDGGSAIDDEIIPIFIAEDIESSSSNTEDIETVTLPVTVVNNTGEDIYELYASTVDVDNWEEDILGDQILPAGQSFIIEFTYPPDQTDWDFAMVDALGNMTEFYGLDFSECSEEGATLTLKYDGEEATAILQ